MIAQGIVIQGDKVLMVQQFVKRGDVVWNFPGGGMENEESPEEACIREVKEETGYDVKIKELLLETSNKYTYIAEIIGGNLYLDSNNEDNADIVEVAWVGIGDVEKFDKVTSPLLELYFMKNK